MSSAQTFGHRKEKLVMFWFDLIWAFLLAWLFVLLLTGPIGYRYPSRSDAPASIGLLFLFLIFFLAIWAGGVWVVPFGPTFAGTYWLPFVLVGFFVLLLIAAAASTPPSPAERPRTPAEVEAEAEEAAAAGTALSVFFWILLIGLVAVIIVSYVT